jgi:hypothetical protein
MNPIQSKALRFVANQLMHTTITLLVLAGLLFGAVQTGALEGLLAPAAPTAGNSLTTINYQGRLADAAGNPIDNASPGLGMTFSLYDVDTGGSPLWSETHANVPVSAGLFNVRLGSLNALSTELLAGDRWLGIQVGIDAEMAPRELLSASPYAMVAGMALTVPENSITANEIVGGSIDGTKLSSTSFGSSNVPLRNFVIREPVATADLTNVAEVSDASWDLSAIVGDSAEMVALLVWLSDDAEASYFRVWPNGETKKNGINAPYVRAPHATRANSGVIWVRCDDNQVIRYETNAIGSNNTELDGLQVTVIGWVEPAAIP